MPVELTPELYAHLRAIAGRVYGDKGHKNLTLHPTELVHEAWLKLADRTQFESRLHFVRTAALVMRQLLVDHERARGAQKRFAGQVRTTVSGLPGESLAFDLVELDATLDRLQEFDPDAAEVTILRCFGGLTLAEAAEALGVSDRTVSTRWRHARAWLIANMGLQVDG